jgi:hypothetical protein
MKYCVSLFFLFTMINNLQGQGQEADTTISKDCDSLRNIEWLVDSAYGAFRTEKFGNMRTFFHSYKTYKGLIDTSLAGEQSEATQFVMYNTRWNYLRIQYTKMIKKIHGAGIKWEKTVLDSFYLQRGVEHGYNFAYIYWVIKYNNKRSYILSAVAVQIDEKWFIMDELRYGGVVPEKKKLKKVKKAMGR